MKDSTLYDTVPYPPLIHPETHPDRIAVTARLLGLSPPPPRRCRVLDLGCGIGSNILAMAELLPESRFVGIDLSENQINEAQRTAGRLGLENAIFRQADIMDLRDDFDQFDYVIAHGLYAWVPEPVRQKTLRLIAGCLAPNGVAYVSYATYPGAYPMQAVRDMMRYRTRAIADPMEKARTAREFIEFLAAAFAPEAGLLAEFVRQYAGTFLGRQGALEPHVLASLSHDELADVNEPLYFHEFAAQAEAAGLEYLAEVDLRGSTPIGLNTEAIDALSSFPEGLIDAEQYMDFVRNRGFRRTLLCHPSATVERTLSPERGTFEGLSLASSARPRARRGSSQPGVTRFVARNGLAMSMDYPLTTAALLHLNAVYPRAVPFEELMEVAVEQTGSEPDAGDADTAAYDLLQAFLFGRSLLELYVEPLPVATTIRSRPRVSAYARDLASQGVDAVPNLRHEPIRLGDLGMRLLPLLDGTRNVDALAKAINASEWAVRVELRWLARAAMLMGR